MVNAHAVPANYARCMESQMGTVDTSSHRQDVSAFGTPSSGIGCVEVSPPEFIVAIKMSGS